MTGTIPDASLPEAVREVIRSPSAGEPLVPHVRASLENSLEVSLAPVQVHTHAKARSTVSSVGARAFTYGTHVFLGEQEQPTDLALMAHEVTHVVQQQGRPVLQMSTGMTTGDALEQEAQHTAGAVQRGERTVVRGHTDGARPQFLFERIGRAVRAVGGGIRAAASAVATVAGNIIDVAFNFIRARARSIPGYDVLGFILGRDPLTQQPVERNVTNLFRAIIGFLPFGNLVLQALQRHGVIDRAGAWVQQQLDTLGTIVSSMRQALDRFLGSLRPADILDVGNVWDRGRRIFTEPIDRIISFVRGLAGDILRFIRDAILRPVARLAQGTRGYDLLKLVLAQDPITGDPYPRTAENMIGGFMRLIGQEEKWQHLQQSRAIPRAWAWFQEQAGTLMGFVREIPQLFVRAWQALQVSDLLDVAGAFGRVRSIFGGFVNNFTSWAGTAAVQIMMFIFEALAPRAMPVLRRAAAVLHIIIGEPIRFVGNLVRAGAQGFRQFSGNIRTHLVNGLVGWLTGALTGAGLQLPQRWDLRGILSLVLQILGLTWQNIRQKLLRHIPEPVLRGLETTFDIVVTLVREGPAAAWQKILEQLQNLQEMVFGGIRDWVARTVVGRAVIRIVSMLNPAGAVIQAIIAIKDTIMFVSDRLQQIIQVAEAFFNSIAQIASGNIGAAANYVEQTMGRLVPVVIGFLANFIGLSGISDTIRNIINRIRAPIDRALDRVVDWIVAQARRLGNVVMGAVRRGTAQGDSGRIRPRRFRAAGHQHQLYVEPRRNRMRLIVASVATDALEMIQGMRQRISSAALPAGMSNVDRELAGFFLSEAEPITGQIQGLLLQPESQNRDEQVSQKMDQLMPKMRDLFEIFREAHEAELRAVCTGVALAVFDELQRSGASHWGAFLAHANQHLTRQTGTPKDGMKAMRDDITANRDQYVLKSPVRADFAFLVYLDPEQLRKSHLTAACQQRIREMAPPRARGEIARGGPTPLLRLYTMINGGQFDPERDIDQSIPVRREILDQAWLSEIRIAGGFLFGKRRGQQQPPMEPYVQLEMTTENLRLQRFEFHVATVWEVFAASLSNREGVTDGTWGVTRGSNRPTFQIGDFTRRVLKATFQPAPMSRPARDDETILRDTRLFTTTGKTFQGRQIYRDGQSRYYYVDNFHLGTDSEIEYFNPQGRHLGTLHADGQHKDPPISGRTLDERYR